MFSFSRKFLSSKAPVLYAVIDDGAAWKNIYAPQVDLSLFSKIVVGSSPSDFDAAANKDTPIVMAVMAKEANAVIRKVATDSDKRVKWIHSLTTGVDTMRLPTLVDVIGDIPVSNARGVFKNPMAEHVVLSCLYFNRKVWRIQQQKREKTWDRFASPELKTQSMGIVGYGDIAAVCAKAVRSFGMEVTGLRRTQVAEGTVDEHGVTIFSGEAGLERILTQSDFILNLMPNTSDNYHMFNKALFSKMKNEAVFINIGRGATVSEDDLYDALTSGTIAGAALDVFEVEPLQKESKLYELGDDKLLMTPHNCDITPTCFQESAAYFGDLAKAYVKTGAIPHYLVDIRKGY